VLIFRALCGCDVCMALRKDDRAFQAKIIRIGRKYNVPNKRLLRPLVGFTNKETGEIEYARLPYEFDG
jgi:hypothetical protein